MEDLVLKDKNNQKKTLSVYASGTIATEHGMHVKIFTIPANSIVTDVYAVVLKGTGDDNDKIDVYIKGAGAGLIGSDIYLDTPGVKSCDVTPKYITTASDVMILNDSDLDDSGRFRLVVEYTELDLANGTYTD